MDKMMMLYSLYFHQILSLSILELWLNYVLILMPTSQNRVLKILFVFSYNLNYNMNPFKILWLYW